MHDAKQPPIDLGQFDPDNSDRSKIDNGAWVPCRICERQFRRLRLTARYCNTCQKGACEGEHMNFAGRGGGVCVYCFEAKSP